MPHKLTSADERKLVGVNVRLVNVVRRFALTSPLPFVITEGVRTYKRQRELYVQKKTKTLQSKHLVGRAVDIAPIVGGRASYDWGHYHAFLAHAKAVAVELGTPVTFGYDWGWDAPHWELKDD